MKLIIELPVVVRRLLQAQISAWDPRVSGAVQRISIPGPAETALLTSEIRPLTPLPRELTLVWAKWRDPKVGSLHWKVSPCAPADLALVQNLEMELTHHFDDPFEVA
jgi:hypothetical protein